MEGTVPDGVLECTPPMADLSPRSIEEVEKAIPKAFQHVWVQNCSFPGDGSITDLSIVGCLDEDGLQALESDAREVATYSHLEQQYYLDEEQTAQQPQQQQQQQQVQNTSTAPPVQNSVPLPGMSSFGGDYGFDVSCLSQTKATRSVSFTYNESRRKLFANLNAVCPFHVCVNKAPPPGTVVRVMAVYSQPNDTQEVVVCCLVHIAEAEKNMKPGEKAPVDHLITCDHHSVQYHKNEAGRHSITVQYEEPEAKVPYTEYRLRFMCLSSCSTGMNRRPVKLMWTLEHNGNVLGRQGIDLKVCACPGRDRKNEEKLNARQMNNALLELVTDGRPPAISSSSSRPGHISTVTHDQSRPQKRGWVTTTTVVAGSPAKAMHLEQQPEAEGECYMIRAPDKKVYNMLQLLLDSLVLYKRVDPHGFRRALHKLSSDMPMLVKSEPKEGVNSCESQE